MANETVAIRLTSQGGPDIVRALEQIGLAAQQQFRRASSEARQFSAAAAQLVAAPTIKTAVQAAIDSRVGVNDSSGAAARAADIAAYGAELERVRTKLSPLFAAERQYLAALEETNQAARAGAITERERSESVARTTAAFSAQIAKMREAGSISGGAETALAGDIITSIERKQAQTTINANLGVRENFGAAARAADIAAYGAELDQLRAKYSPLFAAQQRYKAQLDEIRQAERAGALTQAEASIAIQRTKDAFAAQVVALRGAREGVDQFATSSALSRHELINLSRQAQDVVVSLASGQAPLTVLIQQGSQIGDVFASHDGGAVAGVKSLSTRLLQIATPARVASAGILGVAAAALSLREDFVDSQRALDVANAGIGRGAGATIARLNEIAEAGAKSGKVSVSSAREMEVAFLRTGKIGAENFAGLIAIAKDYATTVGVDVDQAVKELAASFADPVKGADALGEKVGELDARTKGYIKSLADNNDRTGAQKALLDAIAPKLVSHERNATAIGRAWDYVKRAASDASDALGRTVDRTLGGTGGDSLQKQLADLEARRSRGGFASAKGVDIGLDAQVASLKEAIRLEEERTQKNKESAQAAEASNNARAAAENVLPVIKSYDDLIKKKQDLNALLSKAEWAKNAKDIDAANEALLAVNHALQAYKDADGNIDKLGLAQRRLNMELKLYEDSLKAKTPEEVADIARRRKKLDLYGTEISTQRALKEEDAAAAKAFAEATHGREEQSRVIRESTQAANEEAAAYKKSGEAAALRAQARSQAVQELPRGADADIEARTTEILRQKLAEINRERARQVSAMGEEASARERLNEQVRAGQITSEQADQRLAQETELRRLLSLAMSAEGAERTALLARVDDLRGAYSRLTTAQQEAVLLRRSEDKTASQAILEAEIALVGKDADERARRLAVLREEIDLRRQGISLASPDAQRLIDKAGREAIDQNRLDRSRQMSSELESSFDSAFGHVSDLLVEGKTAWKDWGDAAVSIVKEIEKEMIKLAIVNPLKNALFGANLPEAGGFLGSIGGIFGNLFGGGSGAAPIPTMAQGGYGPDMPIGFANGGVMTSGGPLPLRRYAAGGIADSPQFAMFGEGSHPEAYVPLPDGRTIPVTLQSGASESGKMLAQLAANSGREAKTEVVFVGAPEGTQVKKTRQANGDMRIEASFRRVVSDMIASGSLDQHFSTRYGVRARPKGF